MNNYFKKIRRVDQITFFVILLSILIILLRSFNLQFTESEKYSSLIKNYEIKEHIISTSRGSIVDRNNIVLAESIPMKTLIISNKEKFIQDHSALKKLCKIINIDFEYLLKIVKIKKINAL
jgi:cell division protein FtsI/penicillin-binding protein 2